jgi:hypothetical protein
MNKAEAALIAIEGAKQAARNDFRAFVQWTKPDYEMMPFHRTICQKLNEFERGEIKKMMLFVPPQHGKSELTTRRLPGYLLGRVPNRKIALGTYSATLAAQFNRDMQRVIDCDEYHEIFPDTILNESNVVSDARQGYVRNSEVFETIGFRGFVKTIGRGGALTGTPVDIGIIDDPLKDRMEANSHTIRETLWSWFTDVFETRLHNDSQILIILTRWHEDDLAGRILERDNDWVVLKFPAIKTDDEVDYDDRKPGDALWPEKHSLERLTKIKADNPYTFNSLYQQTPQPDTESLVFTNWRIGKFDDDLQFIFGQDYGFSNDPTTLVKVAVSGRKMYLHECYAKTGLSTDQIFEMNKQYAGYSVIVGDSAEPRLIEELLIRGLNIKPAIKGQGSVSAGLLAMQDYEIIVTPESKGLIRELTNYVYLDRGSSIVIDDYNHRIDAARYAFTWLTDFTQPKQYYQPTNKHAL